MKLKKVSLVFSIFILISFIFGTETYYVYSLYGKPDTYFEVIRWYLISWTLFAAYTPLIIYLSKKYPVAGIHEAKGNLFQSILVHFAAGVILSLIKSVINYQIRILITRCPWEYDFFLLEIFKQLTFNLLIYCGIATICHMVNFWRITREYKIKTSEMETQLAKAQLAVLKVQLHPHFLFNTLHAISALVYKDPASADKMISKLSELLRLTLDKSKLQEVSLKEELDFLNLYLEIEKTRFRDRLTIETRIENGTHNAVIPSLLLQPLVENAIRHGLSPKVEGGNLEICTTREFDKMIITIKDDGIGFDAAENSAGFKGFGLENTQKRLEQLYGKNHRFDIENIDTGGTCVTIEIPFRLYDKLM